MNKIEFYLLALQYDSYGEKYLTHFDRMFIHKAISNLLNSQTVVLPEETFKKVQPKLEYIIKTRWVLPYDA